MNFLMILKNRNGSFAIKDSITDTTMVYYFCTLNQAIKLHRQNNGLKYKHFTKIFLN